MEVLLIAAVCTCCCFRRQRLRVAGFRASSQQTPHPATGHGRLSVYNGTPAVRLWKIRTHRVLGIYSGPSVDRGSLDNENPELPANVDRLNKPEGTRIFGDFEVCPLDSERPGEMQPACIEAAKNVVTQKP